MYTCRRGNKGNGVTISSNVIRSPSLKVKMFESYVVRKLIFSNRIHINDIIVGFVTSGFALSLCGFLMSILSCTIICPCVNFNVINACGFLCLYFPVSVYTTINSITILYHVGCLAT